MSNIETASTPTDEKFSHSHHEQHHQAEPLSQHGHGGTMITDDIEPTLHWRTWAVYAACCLLAFGTNYAVSATGFWLSAALPYLAGDTRVSIWIAEGFLVLQVAVTPFLGQLSDFGSPTRRVMVILLSTVGSAGLIVGGTANTINVCIIGVVFYGCSLVSFFVQFSIVAEVIPRRMRGVAQGSLYAILGLGAVLNDTLGGVFIEQNTGGNGGWRWNFFLSAIFQVLGIFAILAFYRPRKVPNPEEGSYWYRMKTRIDWVGNALWMAAFIPFMMGLIWGGNRYEWKSAPVLACLCLGGGLGIVLAIHQVYFKKDGIYHHGLFKHRNFALSLAGIFIEGVVYITMNIFTPSQVGTLYESRPLLIGVHFSILLLVASASAHWSGWYSQKFRRVKELLVAGFIIVAGSCVGFALCGPEQKDNALSYAMFALAGFGLGPPEGLLLAVAQLAVEPEFSGLATAHMIGIRSMGGTIGAAIASAIFTQKIGVNLPARIAEYATEAGVPAAQLGAVIGAVATGGRAAVNPGVTSEQLEAAIRGYLKAFAQSYAFCFWSIVPWSCAAAICMLFLGSVREQMTWAIDAPIESAEALGILAPGHGKGERDNQS